MSVIIVFSDGTDWFKANWVFRQLARDVSDRYSGDAEVCQAMEVAQALGALDLPKMNDELRQRAIKALKAVTLDTISGTIAGWRPHDANEHALYCKAMTELAKRLERQDNIGAPLA
jgi:hypothetical protein